MRAGFLVSINLFLITSNLFGQSTPEGLNLFEQKIRPVLVKHCYKCHSEEASEEKKLQGKLYLDTAEGMLAGGESGEPVLLKGKSAESLLIKALKFDGLEMPPTGKLTDEIIRDFETWIDIDAPDPRSGRVPAQAKREIKLEEGREWWSFQPFKDVTPPPTTEGSRFLSPVDHFVVAAQELQGLTQGAPATKETLLRRAYFDLIGLPPTAEQMDAFLNDQSPQAFEKVVDELLASQHYGEKWARHWLDVARFAESGGYEFDSFRPGAFHYRDWVIRAFNNDLPFDQFVRMQIAGDKLLPDEYEGLAAVGFLVAGPYPGQVTSKTLERIRYDQLDDMLMTVGGSMLGLTLGCARCHDHKYDPVRQKDYYALAASFARTEHGSKFIDPDPTATDQARERHAQEHAQRVALLQKFAAEELPARFEPWRTAELPKQPDVTRWQVLEPVAVSADRSWLKWLPGGIITHDSALVPGVVLKRNGQRRVVPNEEEYRLAFYTHQQNITSFRLDALADKSLPQNGPGLNGDGSFQLVELKVTARPRDHTQSEEKPLVLKLVPAYSALADKDQPLSHAVDAQPATAWVVRETAKKDNAAIFELETPLAGFAGGTELVIELKFRDAGLGRMRFSLTTQPNPSTWAGDFVPQHLGEIRAILAAHGNQLPESLREAMVQWFSPFNVDTEKVFSNVREHSANEPRPPLHFVYTTVEGGQDVFLLRRGEVDNKQGKSEADFLEVLKRGDLPPNVAQADAVDPRVSVVNWLTDVEHGAGPLLARVIVNRIWQHHFGNGIVGTPNDFGAQGERPSHPELLEWLARELVRGGWKLKSLHKQMMLSATYQQSHEVSAENLKRDPTNRYLWHHQPQRLDAEQIRDSLLSVGGNLDSTLFGESTPDTTPRRSVYLRLKRSELIPLMTMFDAPEPTQSVGERIRTTVPTQSLAMMNSTLVLQQAERLAQRVRPAGDQSSLEVVIGRAYQIALARRPTEPELIRLLAFAQRQIDAMAGDPAATDKALIEFCHALLCLNEFIYID